MLRNVCLVEASWQRQRHHPPGDPNPIPSCLKEHNHGKEDRLCITPMTDAELDDVLGARKEGWVVALTKDCHANTKTRWLGCC